MKNYIVKALKGFDDYEGLDIVPENPHIWREKNAIFNCTKERYEYLKDHNAVAFMGIDKIEEKKEEKPKDKVFVSTTNTKEEKKRKSKKSK